MCWKLLLDPSSDVPSAFASVCQCEISRWEKKCFGKICTESSLLQG